MILVEVTGNSPAYLKPSYRTMCLRCLFFACYLLFIFFLMTAPISNHQARTQASHDIIAPCLDVVFAFAVIEGRTVYPQHAALCIIMKDKKVLFSVSTLCNEGDTIRHCCVLYQEILHWKMCLMTCCKVFLFLFKRGSKGHFHTPGLFY